MLTTWLHFYPVSAIAGEQHWWKASKYCTCVQFGGTFALTWVWSVVMSMICRVCEVCVKHSYLTPLANSPLRTQLFVAGLSVPPLVFVALPVHQPSSQVVHTVRLSPAAPTSTRLRTLWRKEHLTCSVGHCGHPSWTSPDSKIEQIRGFGVFFF